MKTKLTISIDPNVVPEAKRYARLQGVSLSSVIEQALRDVKSASTPLFSQRWRGQFRPAGGKDQRYRLLARKYL
jgi:hypothetical protein